MELLAQTSCPATVTGASPTVTSKQQQQQQKGSHDLGQHSRVDAAKGSSNSPSKEKRHSPKKQAERSAAEASLPEDTAALPRSASAASRVGSPRRAANSKSVLHGRASDPNHKLTNAARQAAEHARSTAESVLAALSQSPFPAAVPAAHPTSATHTCGHQHRPLQQQQQPQQRVGSNSQQPELSTAPSNSNTNSSNANTNNTLTADMQGLLTGLQAAVNAAQEAHAAALAACLAQQQQPLTSGCKGTGTLQSGVQGSDEGGGAKDAGGVVTAPSAAITSHHKAAITSHPTAAITSKAAAVAAAPASAAPAVCMVEVGADLSSRMSEPQAIPSGRARQLSSSFPSSGRLCLDSSQVRHAA